MKPFTQEQVPRYGLFVDLVISNEQERVDAAFDEMLTQLQQRLAGRAT